MATYSFLDVVAAMAGPGIAANVGAGAANTEEGITITPVENKNTMQIGADGRGQHNLIASDACTVTIRLLKTSPVNALLSAAYNFQSSSSALWGLNTMTISNSVQGDLVVIQQAAFQKPPELTYAKEGGFNEWVFDAIKQNQVLGAGA